MIPSRDDARAESLARTRVAGTTKLEYARSAGEAAASARPPAPPHGFGLVMLVWGAVVFVASTHFIGPKLVLIYHYGWARVQRDGLSVVKRTNLGARRWTVSNGDQIHVPKFEQDILTFYAPWLGIMAVTVPLLWLLWRLCLKLTKNEQKIAAGGNG